MVTLGPTVRGMANDDGDNMGSSPTGIVAEGRGREGGPPAAAAVVVGGGSGWRWDRWKTCPQAKPMRISFSVFRGGRVRLVLSLFWMFKWDGTGKVSA